MNLRNKGMNEFLGEEIKKYNVITFDVFDTLLKRIYTNPDDLFAAVEEQVSDAKDFARQRKNAEKKARKKYWYKEVNFDEIYDFIEPVYGRELSEKLKKTEANTEIESALPNQDIVEVFNKCKSAGKKIYIISDMYLPGRVISKMLEHIGVTGYEKLYVSSDYRKTKAGDGMLFTLVLKENGLVAGDVLHIGDNKGADFDMPRKKGLSAWLVKKGKVVRYDNKRYLKGAELISFCRLENFINASMPNQKSLAFRDGYEVFGPILWSYISWLKMKVQSHNIDKILFFARDGYVLQKAYRILDPETPSEYFYISRRAVVVPELSFGGTLDALFYAYKSWPQYIKVSQLLSRAGLDNTAEIHRLLYKHKLKMDDEFSFSRIKNDSRIISLFQELQPMIIKNAGKQYNYFRKYFEQTAVGNAIAIVDSGGRCTIETALRALLERNAWQKELFGLYVLLDVEESSYRESWLNKQVVNSSFSWLMQFCYYFLEILLSAPHGTVFGYDEKDGAISPKYGPYDYEREEGKKEAEVIKDMQEGALAFISDFNKYSGYGINMSQPVVFAAFRNFGVFPRIEDLLLWGNFRFNADGFKSLAQPRSAVFYLFHPKQFIKDVRSSYWMAGFFCKLSHGTWLNRVLFPFYVWLKKIHSVGNKETGF